MPKNQDLQLLRATRPKQQRHEREQVPDRQIRKRPQQGTTSHSIDGKSAEPTGASPYPRRRPRLSLRTLRVATGEDTDMLDAQGDACADLAELLSLADRPKEATEALEQALARYERKGNLVMAQRAQTRLAELQDAAPR